MTEREEKLICEHVAVPLREYFEVKLNAMDHAVLLARTEMDRRLAELNELRKQVIDDRGQFVLNAAYDITEKERSTWRDAVNTRLTSIETRSVTWTSALGMFFLILQLAASAILYFVLHK